MNIETANRLLQYRKKMNLSQEELAARIGVSRQAVSKWERAEASPDTDNLILLADIYGVSLDELLKGEKETESETQSEEPENNAENNPDSDTTYKKSDKVSFKHGIHVDSKDGDSVHLNFRDGIHVKDKDGTKVDVGWNGIHVEENSKTKVYTDESGNVMYDESIEEHKHSKSHRFWKHFPFWLIAVIGFLVWGFSGVLLGWVLSWVCFLTIPLYYTLVDAIYKRKPSHFAYPLLVVIVYMFFGFLDICGGWSFGWIAFLTIPIYYEICKLFKSERKSSDD